MKKRISREDLLSYTFDAAKSPVLRVDQDEEFLIETQDNTGGKIRSEKDLPTPATFGSAVDFEPRKLNPVCGPVFVEGARRGDLLAVSIRGIVPAETGVTFIHEGFGPFADSRRWPELGQNLTRVIRHLPGPSGTTADGTAVYGKGLSWPLAPFIGTIGVAPDFELHSSLAGQLPCAGNWDCRDMKAGSTLFVNCFHEGGLLYVGDVHAGQGDTEWSGTADEVKAEVSLSCRVVKGKKIPYARIEKEDSIVQLFADKPMEDAVHNAITHLMAWMIDEYGMKPTDVYLLLTVNPSFRVNVYQMIRDPLFKYVVGAEFPKKYLVREA
jgi:amidase